jgi:hypothetical protein
MGPSGGPVKINRGGEPWLTHPGLTKNGLRLVGTGRGRVIWPNGESPEALNALVIELIAARGVKSAQSRQVRKEILMAETLSRVGIGENCNIRDAG